MGVRRGAAAVWGFGAFFLLIAIGAARGEVTRVATFDNYQEGGLGASFTDPLSGITFRDPPVSLNFVIEYAGARFGGANFLAAGLFVPGDGFAWDFAFDMRGDLPEPARRVGVDITHSLITAQTSEMKLGGFNAQGVLVAVQYAMPFAPEPVHLEVATAGYDIAYFRVSAGANAVGYKNVSYTIVPEASAMTFVALALGAAHVRRRRDAR